MASSSKSSALISGFLGFLALQSAHAAPADLNDMTPTLTGRANSVTTPTPYQPGMVDNCDQFYFVQPGENCAQIAAKHKISSKRVLEWNNSVGNCYGLWANYYICVHTIGYTPTTELECAGSGWAWGDNKYAVDNAVRDWCDGKDNTDGSYGYAGGQTKNGCFNTPIGSHTIKFSIRNEWISGTSLLPTLCEKIMFDMVNTCPRGGKGRYEDWVIEASVPQGRC